MLTINTDVITPSYLDICLLLYHFGCTNRLSEIRIIMCIFCGDESEDIIMSPILGKQFHAKVLTKCFFLRNNWLKTKPFLGSQDLNKYFMISTAKKNILN